MLLKIRYVKKSWLAHEPKMVTSGSAGCDLFAAEDRVIEPHSPGPVCVSIWKWKYLQDIMVIFFQGQVQHVIILLT